MRSDARWTPDMVNRAWQAYQAAGSLRAVAPQFGVSSERLRFVFIRAGLMRAPQATASYHGCCPCCGNWRPLRERTGFCHQSDCMSSG